jgi:predicted nucleic acid-binding protein
MTTNKRARCPFYRDLIIVGQTSCLTWRIIAATALYLGLPLVTKDHKIRNLDVIQTIWDSPNP